MIDPVVAAYTIGQTPRPDLVGELEDRFPSVRFDVVGALDGIGHEDIRPCSPRGYPLETRLRDGSRIVVDAHFLGPLLQKAIDDNDAHVCAHLILCAGPFHMLEAPAEPFGSSIRRTPLIRPFDVAVAELNRRGHHRLEVVVPFADQAEPAMDKWGAADFACRAHVFAEKPRHRSSTEWLAGLVRSSRAHALVFDYVGLPASIFDEVRAGLDLPVFDLGRLALDALAETLDSL